jgi:hypothetical protein
MRYSEIRDPSREAKIMLQTYVPRVTQFISRPRYLAMPKSSQKLLRNNIEKWLLASLCLCCPSIRNWRAITGGIWWTSILWAFNWNLSTKYGFGNIRRQLWTFRMNTCVFVWPLSLTGHHNWDRLWSAWGRSRGWRDICNWEKSCSVWGMRSGWETIDSKTCISTSKICHCKLPSYEISMIIDRKSNLLTLSKPWDTMWYTLLDTLVSALTISSSVSSMLMWI